MRGRGRGAGPLVGEGNDTLVPRARHDLLLRLSVEVRVARGQHLRRDLRLRVLRVGLFGVQAWFGVLRGNGSPHKIAGQTSPSIHPPIGNSYAPRDFLPKGPTEC